MPRVDNPVVHLAAAVAKLGGYQPPMRLNETTRMYFQRLASISSPEDAFLYQHLEDPAVQEKLRTAHLSQNSNLRTSISPTIIFTQKSIADREDHSPPREEGWLRGQ